MYPPYRALPVDLRSPEAQKVFAEFDAGLYTDFAVMPSEQRAYEIGRLLGVEETDTPAGSAGEAQPAPKSGASVPAYLKTIDGKVGGKVPVKDYQAIRTASVKNPDADSLVKTADDNYVSLTSAQQNNIPQSAMPVPQLNIPDTAVPDFTLPAVSGAGTVINNNFDKLELSLPNVNDNSKAYDLAMSLRNELMSLRTYSQQYNWNQ